MVLSWVVTREQGTSDVIYRGTSSILRKTCRIIALLYTDYLDSQLSLTHVYSIYLCCALRESLSGQTMPDLSTLHGIREILEVDDLELPILFNKSEDANRIIVERITIGSVEHGSELCSTLHIMI